MRGRRFLSSLIWGIACLGVGAMPVAAQTTLNVASNTFDANGNYVWRPVQALGGGFLADVASDQQTGQPTSDLVGTSAVSGFLVSTGTIAGTQYIAFRLVTDGLTLKSGAPNYAARTGVAMDVTGDGKLDIFLAAVGGGGANNIVYQLPGATANTSPSTSSLGTATQLEAFTASNFNYSSAATVMGSSWAIFNGTADGVVTFAVSLSALSTAVGVTVNTSSIFRLVGYTATQANAMNQDIVGLGAGATTSTATFDSAGGGFSGYMNANGDVVPESPAVAWVGSTLACGLMVLWRRRRLARDGVAPLRRPRVAAVDAR